MSDLIYLPGQEAEDDAEIREAKAELCVAKQLAEELYRWYPLRDWMIVVDFRAGVVVIRGTDVSTQKGYLLRLTRGMEDLCQQMKRVGGEILERGALSRAKNVDPEDVEELPRDFRDEVRTVDTNAPEEDKIRGQRSTITTG